MKKVIIISMLLCNANIANAADLSCRISVNTEVVSETTIELEENSKLVFEEVEGFRFMVNNHGASKYELEIFDSNGSSRSYASGYLKTLEDEIGWSFWSRDILIESSCKLSH